MGHEGVLEKKECSCCCAPCFHHTGPCENPSYLDEWEMVSVTYHKKKDVKKMENFMHKKDEKCTETLKLSENHPKMHMKTTDHMKIDMKSHHTMHLKTTDHMKIDMENNVHKGLKIQMFPLLLK